jgi:ammonia channel protein AmtB
MHNTHPPPQLLLLLLPLLLLWWAWLRYCPGEPLAYCFAACSKASVTTVAKHAGMGQ